MSDSLWPRGLQPTRLLCPQNFLVKNTGVGCCALLQWIFLTQGSNLHFLHLLHRQAGSLPLVLPSVLVGKYSLTQMHTTHLCIHVIHVQEYIFSPMDNVTAKVSMKHTWQVPLEWKRMEKPKKRNSKIWYLPRMLIWHNYYPNMRNRTTNSFCPWRLLPSLGK